MKASRAHRPTVRAYQDTDEHHALELWNRAHEGTIGYVPRSVEYWRWCILDRPGMSREDIPVVELDDTLVAYGSVDPEGQVLDFVVDPRVSVARKHELAGLLISALEERARIHGCERIRFRVPVRDAAITSAFRRADYWSTRFDALQWVIVDLRVLIYRLLRHRRERLPGGWSPTFVLVLEPGDYHHRPYPRLRVAVAPRVAVEEVGAGSARDVAVRSDMSTLTDLIFGRVSFEDAHAAGRIQIDPASAVADARLLLELVSVSGSWFTPLADQR